MRLLPIDIKTKIYDKRSHKIKSYYYHHDLRPNSHWIENWGWQTSKIYTNNLGFKDIIGMDIDGGKGVDIIIDICSLEANYIKKNAINSISKASIK